jgi:DNA-binding response OmpR family regulator
MSPHSSILVVDDESVVCESCARILSREGFNVDANTNPVEGLKQAQSANYSAILLDLKMPQMDGIEFLGQLRKTNSDVPVIIITGYPTQDTANASTSLGVSDYLPKPFTPDEIADSVKRVVSARAKSKEAAAKPVKTPAWEPQGEHFRFYDEAWFILGEDATVRAGAVLPRAEAPESVRLPAAGQIVFRGLPLASFRLKDGQERTIPAPVTGKVLDVNSELTTSPSLIFRDPASGGWLARIAPTDLNEDLLYSRTRNVILASSDPARTARQREVLEDLGCRVHESHGAEATLEAAAARQSAAILLDAGSFGASGPETVRRLNAVHPKARIVVMTEEETGLEAAYRAAKIFFYAVKPFEDGEIIDILHNAFRSPDRPAFPEEMESKFLPKWVSRVHITNRKGSKVTLLSFGELLLYHKGVGRQVIGKILDGSYPIETTRGKESCTPADSFGQARVRNELAGCGRLVVLMGENGGQIPGSLTTRNAKELFPGFSPDEQKKITVFSIGTKAPAAPLAFDTRTVDALSEHVLREMVSR